MPKKPNRRRMPRAEQGKAAEHPKKKKSQPLTGDVRAGARVVSRKSPKRNVIDWGPAYLKAFAECGVMAEACRVAGVDFHTVWDRRRSDPPFAAAEKEARAKAADLLESIAFERVIHGLPGRLKFHDGAALRDPRDPSGERFYEEREFDNGLLTTLLKAHKPEVYRDKVDVSGKVEHVGLDEFRERVAKAKASRQARA